jgi:hypothetical protein
MREALEHIGRVILILTASKLHNVLRSTLHNKYDVKTPKNNIKINISISFIDFLFRNNPYKSWFCSYIYSWDKISITSANIAFCADYWCFHEFQI